MFQLECVPGIAVRTVGWLLNATHNNNPFLFSLTFHAKEVSFLHFWNNVTVADDNTTECDQFINMHWTQLSDPIDLSEVVWPDLNDCVHVLIFVETLHILVFLFTSRNIVHVELFENLGHNKIEDWNNIGRIVDNLAVQSLIELEDMIAIDFKHIQVEYTDFF